MLAALAAAAAALAVPSAGAQVVEQVPVGARAIAMGGAFSAIADNGTALYWNPAGLARIGHQEVIAGHADLFGSGIRDNLVSFTLPLSPGQSVAADWYHSGFDDSELGFGENRLDAGWGLKLTPRLHAGASFKYLNRSTSYDGAVVRDGYGFGANAGVLFAVTPAFTLGLVGLDLFDTSLNDSESGSSVIYPRTLRAAAAMSLRRIGTLALDLDDRWHLGVEAYPHPLVAIRAGVQDDLDGAEAATWSYGLGVQAGILRLDWAQEHHPVLESTSHFSLGAQFHWNPARIRIEKVEAADLYTSQIKRYAREPFGSLQVRNLEDEPLEAEVSVFVPELMDAPSTQSVVLRPGASQEIPITAVFGDRALARSEDRPVELEVRASYQSRRLVREDKAKDRLIAYAPGAIRWGAGIEQAAAFVTTHDPAVDALARAASRVVLGLDGEPFGNRNLGFAAAMTDALAALGVAYVPDPDNPFSAISEAEQAVDTVHYPYQTLATRTGDCDDTTVLMAALLQNVGVPTQLVDVPGHITLVVGTGVHERNRLALGVDDELLVIDRDEVWVPIETTALARGFAAAWQTGAESFAGWRARGAVRLVPVAEAQSRYEPVLPPGPRETPRLDEAALRARLEADAARIAEWRREFRGARFGDVEESGASEAGEVQVAEVLLAAGSLEEAERRLMAAAAADSTSPRVENDLAVVLAARGELAAAATRLARATRLDPADPGLWLNLGLVRWAAGDTARAAEALRRGVSLAGGVPAAAARLGRGDAAAAEEARDLLNHLIERTSPRGQARSGQGDRAGSQGPDRAGAVRTSAEPADVARALGRLLYWRR